jgi:hypothetical protein
MSVIDWVVENRQWVFSGIGVAVVVAVSRLIWRHRSEGIQEQSGGDQSMNLQAGRDIHIDSTRRSGKTRDR